MIKMKEGDFIRVDYVGKIKESGEIFDLTEEKVAKERGIYTPNFKYGSVPIVIGGGFLVKGLEEELKRMRIGERKKIIVKPEGGFGERNPKLIKLIPISEFKKQDMNPYPGMPVTINNIRGKVLSISGGRVRVDFNHPLAGKELEYEVEVKEKITDPREKIKGILEFFLKIKEKDVNVTIEKGTGEIRMSKMDVPYEVKERIVEMIKKWVEGIEKVKFVEEY